MEFSNYITKWIPKEYNNQKYQVHVKTSEDKARKISPNNFTIFLACIINMAFCVFGEN